MKKLWIATCILIVSNVFVGCGGGGSSSKDDNSSAEGSKNHAPVAKDTNVIVNKNSSINIPISSIASDTDGYKDIVSTFVTSPTAHGTAVVNGDNIVYTPTIDYNGTDTVNYSITDKGGLSDSGIITVIINSQANPPPKNNTPIAKDTNVTINKNSSTNIAISSIASDADGYSDIVSKVVVSPTTHGTAVVNGDNIVYTPAKDYSGKDTVNYTVTDKGGLSDSGIITITINSQGNPPPPPPNNGNNNNVPIAMDSKVFTKENSSVSILISSITSDPDGYADIVSTLVTSPTAHGVAVVNGDNIVYTPTKDYTGTDTVKYTVSDKGGLSASGDINITIDSLVVFTSNPNAKFTTGESAKLILGEAGFNNTGYLNNPNDGLLFNHAKGIDSDDTHLLLADGNNNRVLIWNSLPTGNVSPDIVLGQTDLTHNNSGAGLNEMNWPTSVATDGTRVFVTDAYNDRVLVWNNFPTTSGEPADFEIRDFDLKWPWGIWTDGTKLIVVSTFGEKVLVWNSIPVSNTHFDYSISSNGEMGTPRTVTTDGSTFLIIGDHNPHRTGVTEGQGSFFWNSFPTSDSVADGFMQDFTGDKNYAWLQGDVTKDSQLFLLARWLYHFDGIPATATQRPTHSLEDYTYVGGDGSDVVVVDSDHDGVDDKLYVSTYNGNKIVGFNSIPNSDNSIPDFVIGSNDKDINPLVDIHHHRGNPVPVCTEDKLFVASDFDRTLSVWNTLPTTDNQPPSFEISFRGILDSQPGSLSLSSDRLLAYAKEEQKMFIWTTLPSSSIDMPDISYTDKIGSIALGADATFDEKYLYVINNKDIAIWSIDSGFPSATKEPDITLTLGAMPRTITTDGNYLGISYIHGQNIELYKVSDIETKGAKAEAYATVGAVGDFNLPDSTIVKGDKLFIADTGFNRIHVWHSIQDAKDGKPADTILGQSNALERNTKKSEDGLFWPRKMCFNGRDLWVGEFKFSGRLVKFIAK